MTMIKGGSGGLLREKIVEHAADRVVIVVDEDKLVSHIGPGKPLPIEVSSVAAGRKDHSTCRWTLIVLKIRLYSLVAIYSLHYYMYYYRRY